MKRDSVVGVFWSQFLLLFFMCQAVSASQPLQLDLAVTFDLDRHALQGLARFTQSAGEEVKLRAGDLAITEVRIDGVEKEAAVTDGLLVLGPAKQQQAVEITFRKEFAAGQSTDSMIDRQAIVLLDNWYPIPLRETAISLSAEIPADFYAVSEADEIRYVEQGSTKKVSFQFAHPLPFVHFIAGPYELHEELLPGGTILATYFFPEDREFAGMYAAKTREYLARYEKLIGPYPYKRYSVVENRLPTGFAMPTFTLLGQSVVRLPFITETSLGHEVLHSWFGNAVGVDHEQGNWCEGLTTYLADQAYAADKGEGVDFRKGQLVKYQSVVAKDNTMVVKDFQDAGDYGTVSLSTRAVGYNKVSMIFHMLRNRLGDEVFFASLRNFYEQHKFQRASWDDLRKSFAHGSGEDLGAFFDQWLNRPDVPVLGIDKGRLEVKDGNPELRFELVQGGDIPYQLTVQVRIKAGKEIIERNVDVTQNRTPVTVSLSTMPSDLVVDPDYSLMRRLSSDELPSVWSRFQGGAEKLAVIAAGEEEKFAAFQPVLEEMNCAVASEAELDEKELSGKNIIFLGTGSQISRGLFATPNLSREGFTLEVRENPLSPGMVAVLVAAESQTEVESAIHKLRHYGKYSYLHFVGGKIVDKRITESEIGQIYVLDHPPRGAAVEKSLDFDEIMTRIARSRVIYVGETHVRQADHLLQYRVLQAVHERHPDLAVGMEMFNRSVQDAIDAYIKGDIDERQFLKDAQYFKNWGYDYRFYRDILQFARANKLPVVALNLDKDVVSSTFKQDGIAGLSEEIRQTLPQERDLSMAGYRERLANVFQSHSGPHFNEEKMTNFVQAQVLWDETMAETVADFLKKNPETKMIVVAGSGHVVKNNAIPPRVARRIDVAQSVVVNVREGELVPEEADYVFFSSPIDLPPSPMLGVMLNEQDGEVVIGGLAPQGGAEKARLKKNDVILAVDGHEVKTVDGIKIALLYKEHGGTVKVKVRRPVVLLPDATLDFEVQL
ncbi:MAG: ChaN family lipoprotein [Pseudomonadota bacterium]